MRDWRYVAASSIGTSHVKVGQPCQDSHVCREIADADGRPVLVLAVSDGAGSAARAEEGSRIACAVIAEAAARCLARTTVDRLEAADALEWLSKVQAGIALKAEDEGDVPRSFACTLLAAVLAEDAAVFIQIGDGAIVVAAADGWRCVHWPMHGEFANTTYFATEDYAADHLAFEKTAGRIDEVALFSDGIEPLVLHYATKSVHAPFFDRMFPAVRGLGPPGRDAALSDALAAYLDSPAICERTDDDKTLILASRRAP